MKKFNLFIFLAVITLFSACQKDNITVTLKTAGSLNVQIADSTGKKFQKVKVHLYSYIESISTQVVYGGEIDTKLTDANGNANFGTLEAGSYYLVTDTIKNENQKYLIVKAIQVISGDGKNIVVNPMEYVGSLKLHIYINNTNGYDTINRKTLKVALVHYNDYVYKTNRQSIINKAVAIKSSDSNGNVEFDNIPSSMAYYAYVYIDNNDTIGAWSSSYYSISKDEIYSGTAYIYMSDLIIIKTSVTLTIEYYSNSTYTYKPVNAANVILVYYNDYSNYDLYYATQNTILSYKVVSGITDNSGVVTFTGVPANQSYYGYIYYDSSNATWISSSIYPYQSQTNIYSRTVTGSYLGLN